MFCIHEWVKLEPNPHFTYWTYCGHHVGIFWCRCKKCGKIKKKKYY